MDWKAKVEEANQLVAQVKDIYASFDGEAMPEEKATEIDELLKQAEALKAEVEREKKAEDMDKFMNAPEYKTQIQSDKGVRTMENNTPNAAKEMAEKKSAAFFKFLRSGKNSLDVEEKALIQDTTGEILVPEELYNEIFQDLPELTVVRNIANVRKTNSNRVRTRSINDVTVGWGTLELGAEGAMPESSLTPTEDYIYVEDLMGLTKIGEDELDDSDVNLTSVVAQSFSNAIAAAEDAAFIKGLGHASSQPEGMTNSAVIPSVDTAVVGEVSIDDFINLVYAVPAQYRKNGSFIVNSQTELVMRKMKDENGQYLWQPSVQAGVPATFLGFPIYNQEDVATIASGAKVAIFGDFKSGYQILDRQSTSLVRLNEKFIELGLIGFRVKYRVGGAVIRPQALRVLTVKA